MVKEKNSFHIRWFTPTKEVDLCGHGTLASAFVLFNHIKYDTDTIRFSSKSGELIVKKLNGFLQLNFPSQEPVKCQPPEYLTKALGSEPKEILRHDDYVAVFEDENDIISMNPDFEILRKIDTRGICVTAPGTDTDFVSRFFAPRYGINEDPVTGSAHCELVPYWSKKLSKTKLSAKQLSHRGGLLDCELSGNRVLISGKAVTYLKGQIYLPD